MDSKLKYHHLKDFFAHFALSIGNRSNLGRKQKGR